VPTDVEIREKARRDQASDLVRWSTSLKFAANANLALTARLIVAIEMLEEELKAKRP
jgi:hypothetical protein